MSRRSPRGNSGGREVVEVLLAGEYGLKGSQEIGSAGTLTNVPGGAQSLRTHGVRGIGVPAQYKHAGGGITAADLLENVPGGAQSLRTHGVRGIGVPAQY